MSTRDYWGWTEGFYAVGFRPGDITQITFNYHMTPAGLMFEEPLRNLNCSVMPAGPGNTNTQLDIMQKVPEKDDPPPGGAQAIPLSPWATPLR